MGNCIKTISEIVDDSNKSGPITEYNAPSNSSDQVLETLFFPDEAMPCRHVNNCHRRNCEYSHKETSLIKLLAYIKMAKTTLDICVFTITCNEIAHEIQEAHRRGVKVRVITDDDQSRSNGSDIQTIASAGIPVRDDRTNTHMHHKFCVIDQTILLNGSFNWTRQAVLGNRENVMAIRGPVADTFTNYFNTLWRDYECNQH